PAVGRRRGCRLTQGPRRSGRAVGLARYLPRHTHDEWKRGARPQASATNRPAARGRSAGGGWIWPWPVSRADVRRGDAVTDRRGAGAGVDDALRADCVWDESSILMPSPVTHKYLYPSGDLNPNIRDTFH